MKLLKRTGIFFALLIGIYGLLIFVMPASTYQVAFAVNRSPEVAWKVFNDESRMQEWLIGLKSMELLSGEMGAAGSRYRMVFEEDGEVIEMEELMLSVVPEKEFSFRLSSDFLTGDIMIRFEPSEEGTRITTENTIMGMGVIAPLMPLMVSSMEDRQKQQYELLKAMIEAEPQSSEGK